MGGRYAGAEAGAFLPGAARRPSPISPSPQDGGPGCPRSPEHPSPAHLRTPCAPERGCHLACTPRPPRPGGAHCCSLCLQASRHWAICPPPWLRWASPRGGTPGAPSLHLQLPAPRADLRGCIPRPAPLRSPPPCHPTSQDTLVAVGHCLRLVASLIPLTSNRTGVPCTLPGSSGHLGTACPL